MRSHLNLRRLFVSAALMMTGIAVLGAPGTARAQYRGHPFGLGLQLGNPTGISGKAWTSSDNAVQFTFGWETPYRRWWDYYAGPFVTVDWVHQLTRLTPESRQLWFGLHVGVGGGLGWVQARDAYCDPWGRCHLVERNDPSLLLRVPLGLDLYFSRARLEIYAELVPSLRIAPFFGPDLFGAFGGRYYF